MPCNRLPSEHIKIRLLSGELVDLVSSPTPCDSELLAAKRWELARVVHLHLAYEDRQLFQRLMVDRRAEVRAAALEGKRCIEQLHGLYRAHVERWTAGELVTHWQEFQTAVKALVRRMTLRMDSEERELFPLLNDEDEILPRWQPGARNWAGDGVAQPLIQGVGVTR
ncbi:MAG: hemerythrin domain-containing protein [Sphingomonas sp.]